MYNSSDVLIVGLAFRISIPFRNPHAGVQETGSFKNSRNLGILQLVCTEMSAGRLLGKPGEEDLQLRLLDIRRSPKDIGVNLALQKGNFPPFLFLSLTLQQSA
jgi:hypothetical protein